MDSKIIILVTILLTSGTTTTLLTKFCNNLTSEGKYGDLKPFRHPFLQCWALTVGEFTCLIIYLAWKAIKGRNSGTLELSKQSEGDKSNQSYSPFLFIPASLMHLTSRCLGYLALTLTAASSYQMISGCLFIFAAIFSKIFLSKKYSWPQWLGVFITTSGVVLVGLSDFLFGDKESHGQNPITGDICALVSMVFWAGQMVFEEKYVKKYKIDPMKALGMEGAFSFSILSILLAGFYFIKVPFDMGQPDGQLEDAGDGFIQLANNLTLLACFLTVVVFLIFTSLAAIRITVKLSAVHKIIFNTGRQVLVWIFALGLGWSTFNFLQLGGFIIMVIGMLVFNDLIFGPTLRYFLKSDVEAETKEEPAL